MKEISWNNVIWLAIKDLKNLFERYDYRYSNIDEIFFACEKELYALSAPERETDLRLFALALYCYKTYSCIFLKTAVYPRYAEILNFFHFKNTAKMLIRENNYALVVFWVIFRLSFENFIPQNSYSLLEKEMRDKSLELGTNFVY